MSRDTGYVEQPDTGRGPLTERSRSSLAARTLTAVGRRPVEVYEVKIGEASDDLAASTQ